MTKPPQMPDNDEGFQRMMARKAFLEHIRGKNPHNTHFKPVWLHPKLADAIVQAHGPKGLAMHHHDDLDE